MISYMNMTAEEYSKIPNNSNLPVVFFDLDNTLYSEERGVHMIMAERIIAYLKNVVLQKLWSSHSRHD
jgi:FMN phosphatase YigB (HAD superfamily)